MNPEPELYNLMRFMLGTRDLEGTNAERRIKEVIGFGKNATQTYSLKDTTRRCNSNAHKYTEEQRAWVQDHMKEMLHFFGYARVPQDPDNVTGFFEFDGSDEALVRQYNGWRVQNEDMVNWACQLTDADLENINFELHDPKKDVPVLTLESSSRANKAVMNYYQKQLFGAPYEQVD